MEREVSKSKPDHVHPRTCPDCGREECPDWTADEKGRKQAVKNKDTGSKPVSRYQGH